MTGAGGGGVGAAWRRMVRWPLSIGGGGKTDSTRSGAATLSVGAATVTASTEPASRPKRPLRILFTPQQMPNDCCGHYAVELGATRMKIDVRPSLLSITANAQS